MILIEHSALGNMLEVETSIGYFEAEIVEKPFYDPNKKITKT